MSDDVPRLREGDRTVRDLNKNGRIDPYEDPTRPLEERVEDLLSQMTLAEKAGLMFHTIMFVPPDGAILETGTEMSPVSTPEMVSKRLISHFNVHALPEPRLATRWHNRLQELAARTRLGIPVTISSDPRHGFAHNVLTSARADAFSQWPEPIGLASIGDPETVRSFAEIARQEYLAVGIRVALHPMADLATEPRWGRISGTFGEDAALSSELVAAYIRGFQGETLGPDSVACMTKHFPGGGPQLNGEDAHFPTGREQVYPGGNWDYHLMPFEAAFAAGTSQIMPYYGMPVGVEGIEAVGFGFNRGVITGLLRERYGFDGIVCTDWGLVTDKTAMGRPMLARAWGVEHLSREERVLRVLAAGADQFGGEECPDLIVSLVESGRVSEARIDESARRLLREKFRLGLFDWPYVDEDTAGDAVGTAAFAAAGMDAQRRSLVLLKNEARDGGAVLPVRGRPKAYVENVDSTTAATYADVVDDPQAADLIILRLAAPYESREGFLESRIHSGSLAFSQEEQARVASLAATAPTVAVVYMDRPAVMPEIAAACAGVLAEFGASDEAVLDVIFGRARPEGKLPFEIPASMAAVQRQRADVPHDSGDPLYPFGFGLRYPEA